MRRIPRHPILDVPTPPEVTFRFNGKELKGHDGEMISSALFANDVQEFSIHEKGDAPRGIFCANGQCAQCTVIVDGFPLKSCVTPLREGMDVRTLEHRPSLPPDDAPPRQVRRVTRSCDVLVIGGGPSGLTATRELVKLGFKVILVDDKAQLGGKLLLQTHKFFGSIEDCYAGTRGVHIAARLEADLRALPQVEILTQATVVGIFKDRKAGIFVDNKGYVLVEFKGLVVSTGARERSLVFPGNDLPGVYGAGAFQTLVNRDLIRAADRVLIVGSGNVGLIAGYHALQAGIQVVGVVDVLDRVSGYRVHADKLRRMGVPIWLHHTILSAEGEGRVQQATIAEVDASFTPILSTCRTFAVDTVLVAVGLMPVDEFDTMARKHGFPVIKAGDAEEIAEASSAMFGGRIAGIEMAKALGADVAVDPSWTEKARVLKSKPGPMHPPQPFTLSDTFKPVLHCLQEIPCNPCTSVCPEQSIHLEPSEPGTGSLMDVPVFEGHCIGCRMCVAICPGLAISLARRLDADHAEVVLPHEFEPGFKAGDLLHLADREGHPLGQGQVLKVNQSRKHRTWLIHLRVAARDAAQVAGIRVQDPSVSEPLAGTSTTWLPEEAVVCRCERVTVRELVDHIREFQITDVNHLKQVRAGMGACGAKTCSSLFPRIFKMAGVDPSKVVAGTPRPLTVEVPMHALLNERSEP